MSILKIPLFGGGTELYVFLNDVFIVQLNLANNKVLKSAQVNMIL